MDAAEHPTLNVYRDYRNRETDLHLLVVDTLKEGKDLWVRRLVWLQAST